MSSTSPLDITAQQAHRQQLRQRLRAEHKTWCLQAQAVDSSQALSDHLASLLITMEPTCLGLYWPLPGEFDPGPLALQTLATGTPLALPWAFKVAASAASSPRMVFRQWDGQTPTDHDECGTPSPATREAAPDVLLVPCVGVTRSGWRLGFGKGYYDRYLAAHPHVTPIGVAWSHALLSEEELAPQAHDQAMMLVVTPDGVVSAD